MADDLHIENRLLAISPRFIVRLTRYFVRRSRITFRHRSFDQNTKFWKFKMADGRHLKMVLSLYLSRESSDSDEIWCADSYFGWRTVTCWFIQIYEIQNGGRSPYWKSFFGYISTIYCPINVKFNLIWRSRITFRYRSRDQNTKIWKLKMADDRHFENGFITISQLQVIRFQWNLVCRWVNWFQEQSIIKVSKFCKFKIADDHFVCERLYVRLQISRVLWVNRRCPPILIVIQV